ncbi:ArgS-related anticodon-binding protein NrtL [Streptomyces sp. NBC_01353]|uniref:ArgS-related anticodon-binding protein NrtL n=1 Tax=Streptomyces sp. NBC_01353 TaxID=2903835 RepID=UPI002E33AF73|nr:DALR anticodon-binding domain-containing protein [Streptomyces sp. NBC_01353]
MTPADLSLTVLHAVRRAVDDGALRVDGGDMPRHIKIERPRPGGRGDYASNVALTLARAARRTPLDVASILKDRLHHSPGLAAVDITGPGFLNFTLRQGAQQDLVREILRQGHQYGWRQPDPTGHPTGHPTGQQTGRPTRHRTGHELVHRADLRAAVTADSLRRILASQGTPVRTHCQGAPDPDWALLGVRIEDQGEQSLPVDIAPLPVPDAPRALLRRLGVDAARWGLLSAASHDRARLGDELLHQHEDNPLFRVRYAYSRTRALLRNAEQLQFSSRPDRTVEDAGAPTPASGDRPTVEDAGTPTPAAGTPAVVTTDDAQVPAPAVVTTDDAQVPAPAVATTDDAQVLTRALGDHPVVLAGAARHRAPDRVARHLEVVADALLDFQHTVLPLGDEKPSAAHRSRLALAEAAGVVLAGGLSLLGISAPDQI